MENMEQETHSTKMGADESAKNTLNAPKFICPNCLAKLESFNEKRLHWASVVRVLSAQPPLHRRLHHHFFLQKCCCLLEHFKEHERGFILFEFN